MAVESLFERVRAAMERNDIPFLVDTHGKYLERFKTLPKISEENTFSLLKDNTFMRNFTVEVYLPLQVTREKNAIASW